MVLPDTEAVKLLVPQAYEAKEPQEPVNIWSLAPELVRFAPKADNATVTLVSNVAVVNLYHTSSSGVPVAQPTEIPLLAVAPHTVPALLAVPLVIETAPLQSSLDGGGGGCTMQILKSDTSGATDGSVPTLEKRT